MSSKFHISRLPLCLLLLALAAALPAFAGSAVVGSVAGSLNAAVGGQTLLPNTTLFSGDSLQVKDGVAVVALGGTSRMVFGRDTIASFLRDSNEVAVLLSQGDVSVFHAEDNVPLRVKAGVISVIPASGFKTLGEVAMLNGTVVVTTKEGLLRVEGNGQAINVAKGKTITVNSKASAPSPQGNPGGGPSAGRHMSGSSFWGALDATLAGAGLVVAGVSLSRSSTASDNATTAASNAAAASSNASAAASAAAAAASAAAAAASAANASAIASGCALNIIANEQGKASPYTPPAGVSCSNPATW